VAADAEKPRYELGLARKFNQGCAGMIPARSSSCLVACLLAAAPAVAAEAKTYPLGVAVSGLVAKWLVADGAHVAAGQPILAIDCRPLEADLTVKMADAAAAEAAYTRVKNGPRPDEVAIAEANVGVAQARAEEAGDAYARLKSLTEGVAVTKAQVLQDRRDARVTAAQLNDSEKRLALLHAGSRQEDIDEAAARRDAAAAEVGLDKAKLDQCTLKAPVAGVVDLLATPGQFVSEYAPATLVKLTPDAK
jgi:HlyD family secretion protein